MEISKFAAGAYASRAAIGAGMTRTTTVGDDAKAGNDIARPSAAGFGIIKDVISLSPEAIAAMAARQTGTQNSTESADTENSAANEKAEKATVSDPFRAYRGANGEISMEAVAQIDMLPPRLRKAGQLMREASSLRDEVAKAEKDPATDPKALENLHKEYDSTMGALWEELDKLGLTKKMKDGDISMDDLLNSGLSGLTALSDGTDQSATANFGTASIKAPPTEREAEADAAGHTSVYLLK